MIVFKYFIKNNDSFYGVPQRSTDYTIVEGQKISLWDRHTQKKTAELLVLFSFSRHEIIAEIIDGAIEPLKSAENYTVQVPNNKHGAYFTSTLNIDHYYKQQWFIQTSQEALLVDRRLDQRTPQKGELFFTFFAQNRYGDAFLKGELIDSSPFGIGFYSEVRINPFQPIYIKLGNTEKEKLIMGYVVRVDTEKDGRYKVGVKMAPKRKWKVRK